MLQERKNCANYLPKFGVDFDGILYAVEIRWSDESHGLLLSCPISIQGRESKDGDVIQKTKQKYFAFACVLPFTDHFFFRLVVVIDSTKLYSLMLLWIAFTFIQGHSYMRKQKLLHCFSCKVFKWFGQNLVCCYDLLVSLNSYFLFVCLFGFFFFVLLD